MYFILNLPCSPFDIENYMYKLSSRFAGPFDSESVQSGLTPKVGLCS
jgi:hypothetical protein